jgi:hypothetical protein
MRLTHWRGPPERRAPSQLHTHGPPAYPSRPLPSPPRHAGPRPRTRPRPAAARRRLRKVVRKLLAAAPGQTLRVGVVGGSITHQVGASGPRAAGQWLGALHLAWRPADADADAADDDASIDSAAQHHSCCCTQLLMGRCMPLLHVDGVALNPNPPAQVNPFSEHEPNWFANFVNYLHVRKEGGRCTRVQPGHAVPA